MVRVDTQGAIRTQQSVTDVLRWRTEEITLDSDADRKGAAEAGGRMAVTMPMRVAMVMPMAVPVIGGCFMVMRVVMPISMPKGMPMGMHWAYNGHALYTLRVNALHALHALSRQVAAPGRDQGSRPGPLTAAVRAE